MDSRGIDTRLVYGFLDAGKTGFIQDCVLSDYFDKYGVTLILCFEEGEGEYDTQALTQKRTRVFVHDGEEPVEAFCLRAIEECRPDRIYVEMNIMLPRLREQLPACMRVTYVTTRIDSDTLGLYYRNLRAQLRQMVSESQQVTFRGGLTREELASYAQVFQVMNPKASYLRQDPLGYHERAFDRFVPYSLDASEIKISAREFITLWLDASEHPEHYEGKTLHFTDALELRRLPGREALSAGRVVMACCMADLQFMGFDLVPGDAPLPEGVWAALDARAAVGTAEYGRRVVKLRPIDLRGAQPPEQGILSPE